MADLPTKTWLRPRVFASMIPDEERDRLREGVVYCLKVFVGTRIGFLLLGFIAVGLITPFQPFSVPGWAARPIPDPGWHAVFTAWERFDALWFLRIASFGYARGDGTAWFFPLYPLAIRAVSWGIGWHPFAAAMIVSNVAFIAAICVLFFLTASELSRDEARNTILYISVFPTAFFFFAPYSESLFLLLTVTSLWGARRGRWWLAGITGALAALTRFSGLLMAPVLMIEAFSQRGGWRRVTPKLVWSGVVPIGTALYAWHWWRTTGNLFSLVEQMPKFRPVVPPWRSVIEGASLAFRFPGRYPDGNWLIDLLFVFSALVAVLYATRRLRPCYAVFAWGSLLVPLSSIVGPRPLTGMPRYVAPIFPLFWALAWAVNRRRIPHNAVICVEAAGLGILTILYVNWGIS